MLALWKRNGPAGEVVSSRAGIGICCFWEFLVTRRGVHEGADPSRGLYVLENGRFKKANQSSKVPDRLTRATIAQSRLSASRTGGSCGYCRPR